MSRTQRDKPTAKQRQRARKAEQKGGKRERQVSTTSDQFEELKQDQSPDLPSAVEQVAGEEIPAMSAASETHVASAAEEVPVLGATADMPIGAAEEAALSGEVLRGEIQPRSAAQPESAIGFQMILQAYADYARKSWAARSLVERLMTTRTLDEAVEIQAEFAKQAYANFLAHSQNICALYAELGRQFFRPMENFTTGWTRLTR